ncbi:hypothetical protein [Flavobacterium aquiphilum]|uniref:hypothetical protein n=1 Tax=Flavobacterium aquiphilum TaxID=3003261 RepID=UPI00248100B2|nr:hypothetical protein [Flavobacterium aquiphilum]
MKNLFLTLVVALFVTTASASAFPSSEEPKPVLVETSKELSHLLNSVYTEGFLEKEELGKVLFVVNDLNQIVVLKVQSNNEEIQSYVAKALNYKTLSSKELKMGENYFFVVKFKIKEQQ